MHPCKFITYVSCKCISLIYVYACKWFVDYLTTQVFLYYIDHVPCTHATLIYAYCVDNVMLTV